jgi:hypothetical protein
MTIMRISASFCIWLFHVSQQLGLSWKQATLDVSILTQVCGLFREISVHALALPGMAQNNARSVSPSCFI